MRAFRLPLSLCVAPVAAATLLGVHCEPAAAQLVVEPAAEHAPCPKDVDSRDEKHPCAESGEGASPATIAGSAGPGGGGGGGSGGAGAHETIGPYRIVKVMNLGGEMGFAGPMPMHYVFGLSPVSGGSGCR